MVKNVKDVLRDILESGFNLWRIDLHAEIRDKIFKAIVDDQENIRLKQTSWLKKT